MRRANEDCSSRGLSNFVIEQLSNWKITTGVGFSISQFQNFQITQLHGNENSRMPTVIKKLDANSFQLKDQVVAINRVTKVVKGGKNLSFAALVVVGDPSAAVVGHGAGKAKEVPQAIRKAIEAAKKNLIKVNLTQTSIPHLILGRYGSGKVLLKPAPEGTGVIAGGAVRAVMTSVGIQNVLTKSIGTTNPHNVIKATFEALKQLKSKESVAAMRGKAVQEL